MKRVLCLILAMFLLLSLFGCGDDSLLSSDANLKKDFDRSDVVADYDFLSENHTTPENYSKYTEGQAEFAARLLSESIKDGENTVVSPASVSAVMSLLANGAGGKTSSEIRKAIAGGADTDLINICSHYLSERLSAFNNEEGYVNLANSLWFNDKFDVKSAFMQTATNYHNADIFRLDFAQEDVLSKVNGWVSDKTKGEIESILDELDKNSPAVVVNTALLEDVWATPYNKFQMSEDVFHGAKGDTQAEFMTSEEYYVSTAYAEGFVKGFKNIPCKFAAFMPVGDESITDFAKNLTGNRFTSLIESQQPMERCFAKLPAFSIESELEMVDVLKATGVNAMFDPEKADFSNLSSTGEVYVSDITQKAFIEVGPQGAKAGAATAAVLAAGSAPDGSEKEIKEIVFDKPFVFAIYDNESNVPVFMGVVNNVD